MFKNFKKYPKSKKIRTIVLIVIVLGVVGILAYEALKPDPLPEYELITAEKGSINQTYTATGTVESNDATEYTLPDGVEVLEVKVKVGDKVQKGDLLATFDTSGLSAQLNELKSEYNEALSRYKEAASSSSDASEGSREATIDIAELETKISKLKREIEKAQAKEKETVTSVTKNTKYEGTVYTDEQIKAMSEQILQNGGTEEQVSAMIAALNAAEKAANSSAQNLTAEQLAEMLKDTSAAKSLELAQLETQLATAKTQKTYYDMQSGNTVEKAFKTIADMKKSEYEQFQDMINELDNGWYAEKEGIVTQINIQQGEVFSSADVKSSSNADFSQMLNMIGTGNVDLTNILSQFTSSSTSEAVGMKVDYYDQFTAVFNVGKYDLLSLKVGQEATVSTLGSDYKGVVDYVSATASESTGLDISSITSSLTGAQNTSNSAIAKVKILDPDDKIIIGFDVDISVKTGMVDDVITIPVESLRFENGQKYIFVYNAETMTVEKRTVELGASEDTKYQIASGLDVGEQFVKNPLSSLNDGDKIIVNKKIAK